MPAASTPSPVDEIAEQAIEWLIRLRDDHLGDSEIERFADWLSSDPRHAEAFAKAEDLFGAMVAAAATLPASQRSSAVLMSKQPEFGARPAAKPAVRPNRRRHGWLTAASGLAVACTLVVTLVLPKQVNPFADYFSDYHTQTGEIREIQLSDGSRVLMNTDSALSVEFKADLRQITLHHGQARFSVAADAKRPFQVVTDSLRVRALGTVFDVYRKEFNQTQVLVQEHAVAVTTEAPGSLAAQHATVGEGQILDYLAGQPLAAARAASIQQAAAWQQRRLLIKDRPLADLVAELERYRRGRIFLADATLKNLRVTGVFSLDRPDDALAAVCKALALQETKLGPWWIVLHR